MINLTDYILPSHEQVSASSPGNDISCAALPVSTSLARSMYAKLQAWSKHHLITDYGETITVFVPWKFEADPRGLMRAYRKNGWKRGPIESDNPHAKQLIIDRLTHTLDRNSLRDVKIRRYRFNYALTHPDTVIAGLDIHHIQPNPLYPNAIPSWTQATDDRIQNLIALNPQDHNLLHFTHGDNDFYPYTSKHNHPFS